MNQSSMPASSTDHRSEPACLDEGNACAGASWSLRVILIVAVLSGTILGAVAAFRSSFVRDFVLRSEGHVLVPETDFQRLETSDSENPSTMRFQIRNVTNRPVTIYKADVTCNCIYATDFPIVVPARSTIPLDFKMNADSTKSGASNSGTARLLIDRAAPKVELSMELVFTGSP